MLKTYKLLAQDLYRIKLSTLPKSLTETELSLTNLLAGITEVRPQLRKDLGELSKECATSNIVLPETAHKMEITNTKLLGKMYLLAYQTKKKLMILIEKKVTVKKLRLA
jgi:hypothetical protein